LGIKRGQKSNHQPHRFVGSHLPCGRAEVGLVLISAGNIFLGAIHYIPNSILRVVHGCLYLVGGNGFLTASRCALFNTFHMPKFSVLIFMLTFFTKSAMSCSCRKLSVKENFERSAAVFEGEVLKIDTVGWTTNGMNSGSFYTAYLVTLKILKQYKGNFYSDTVLTITGEHFGTGDCGYDFGIAKRHLVYASNSRYKLIRNSNPDHFNFINKDFIFLETTYCDRTTESIANERNNIVSYLSTL